MIYLGCVKVFQRASQPSRRLSGTTHTHTRTHTPLPLFAAPPSSLSPPSSPQHSVQIKRNEPIWVDGSVQLERTRVSGCLFFFTLLFWPISVFLGDATQQKPFLLQDRAQNNQAELAWSYCRWDIISSLWMLLSGDAVCFPPSDLCCCCYSMLLQFSPKGALMRPTPPNPPPVRR